MNRRTVRNKYNLILAALSIVLILNCALALEDTGAQIKTDAGNSDIRIRYIQGAEHESPLTGYYVSRVPGVVTAVTDNGFYMQDPEPDNNNATSEGIFVFTGKVPDAKLGDYVLADGLIYEFKNGGPYYLGTTQIIPTKYSAKHRDNTSIAPTTLGTKGRALPTSVIEDDASGLIEKNNAFDSDTDGIDFYESLEGMLVKVNNAVAVGPSSCQKSGGKWNCRVPVLSDNGTWASLRTPRGGIVLRDNDSNPERIIISFVSDSEKKINVGDRFQAPIFGVVGYSNNNYEVKANGTLNETSANLSRETTQPAPSGELAIATFNVENFSPTKKDADKAKKLAGFIVNNLKEPDIIALEEITDNNGGAQDPEVDASKTYGSLIKNIQDIKGHKYEFLNINPEDDKDGGDPGSNIRVGFLYRTDRGLNFEGRSGGNATAPTTITSDASGPHLSFNPGRIDPLNPAFNDSRKPLAAEFTFNGKRLFVIANHLNSKGGDTPLYGTVQPPLRPSEDQRHKQAEIVNGFVKQILGADPEANIIVLGDLNDFQFSGTLNALKGNELFNVVEMLPPAEQYSYNFEGNSQELDHILVSKNMHDNMAIDPDIVHIDSEFAERVSDHDPVTARIKFS